VLSTQQLALCSADETFFSLPQFTPFNELKNAVNKEVVNFPLLQSLPAIIFLPMIAVVVVFN